MGPCQGRYCGQIVLDILKNNFGIKVSESDFSSACRAWVESGVQIIGGCCGTTIEHIRKMVDHLPTHVGPRTGMTN